MQETQEFRVEVHREPIRRCVICQPRPLVRTASVLFCKICSKNPLSSFRVIYGRTWLGHCPKKRGWWSVFFPRLFHELRPLCGDLHPFLPPLRNSSDFSGIGTTDSRWSLGVPLFVCICCFLLSPWTTDWHRSHGCYVAAADEITARFSLEVKKRSYRTLWYKIMRVPCNERLTLKAGRAPKGFGPRGD